MDMHSKIKGATPFHPTVQISIFVSIEGSAVGGDEDSEADNLAAMLPARKDVEDKFHADC